MGKNPLYYLVVTLSEHVRYLKSQYGRPSVIKQVVIYNQMSTSLTLLLLQACRRIYSGHNPREKCERPSLEAVFCPFWSTVEIWRSIAASIEGDTICRYKGLNLG